MSTKQLTFIEKIVAWFKELFGKADEFVAEVKADATEAKYKVEAAVEEAITDIKNIEKKIETKVTETKVKAKKVKEKLTDTIEDIIEEINTREEKINGAFAGVKTGRFTDDEVKTIMVAVAGKDHKDVDFDKLSTSLGRTAKSIKAKAKTLDK